MNAPRVLHISRSDYRGGADIAAYRIHRSVAESGVETRMAVRYAHGAHADVTEVPIPRVSGWLAAWSRGLAERVQKSSNPFHRSLNLVATGGISVPDFQPDLVHLHWIGSNALSLHEIQDIPVPVVWTLHDSWPFSGAEHHPSYPADERFISGYRRANRVHSSRVDVDGWVWKQKAKIWNRRFHLVGPSTWMTGQAQRSRLMHRQPVITIPNPLDPAFMADRSRARCRERLGIDSESFVVVSAAIGGSGIENKGWAVLQSALTALRDEDLAIHLLLIGESALPHDLPSGIECTVTGLLDSPGEVADALACGDVFVTTSTIESFGLTAAEASAVGLPVIAPAASGLLDVVVDGETGWLLPPGDAAALVNTLATVRSDLVEAKRRGAAGQVRARQLWSMAVVGDQYRKLYESVLTSQVADV